MLQKVRIDDTGVISRQRVKETNKRLQRALKNIRGNCIISPLESYPNNTPPPKINPYTLAFLLILEVNNKVYHNVNPAAPSDYFHINTICVMFALQYNTWFTGDTRYTYGLPGGHSGAIISLDYNKYTMAAIVGLHIAVMTALCDGSLLIRQPKTQQLL